MSQNKAIDIILRVRPVKKPYNKFNLNNDENKLEVHIPKRQKEGYVNNSKENWSFKFDKVFDPLTSQQTIFKNVAKDVVDSALEGFNGTIFAYGQTGSGKTFTMTGGEYHKDRGLIPNTLSYIFSEVQRRDDTIFDIMISYLEIYNGTGYDLLDEKHENSKLEDLPKVTPRETEDEEIILTGLQLHRIQNEEDGLHLLTIGDNNRVICETPKNDVSTRSHCIFIIRIEARKPDSDVKTISTIHLVDLSGSERIGRTGVEGKLQFEARSINVSLHFLEQVIVSLNKRANGENIHIPYRNSLMTMVLRNSLGGNCKTKMIATVNPQEEDLEESISTCQFAQRVALIKNQVERNETVDPAIIINRLKRENAQLKAEISMLKGEDAKDSLDPEDIERCKKQVQEFIENPDPSSVIILNDRLKINEAFYYFKTLYNTLRKKGAGQGGGNQINFENNSSIKQNNSQTGNNSSKNNNQQMDGQGSMAQFDEIKRLKLLIQQRDNEIMILLNLINKNKKNSGTQEMNIPVTRANNEDLLRSSVMREPKPITFLEQQEIQSQENKNNSTPNKIKQQSIISDINRDQSTRIGSDLTNVTLPNNNQENQLKNAQQEISDTASLIGGKSQVNINDVNQMLLCPLNLTTDQLMDRANCFELFRKSYRKNEVMEENKKVLKERYQQARELGAIVTNSRDKIKVLKNQIEQIRKEIALGVLVDGQNENERHPEEEKLLKEIEKLKRVYKESFDQLKELKAEIERIQFGLERSKEKMQKDFQNWIDVMIKQKQQTIQGRNKSDYGPGLNSSQTTNNTMYTQHRPQKSALVGSTVTMNNNFMQDSQSGKNVNIQDKDVEKNLQAFYKARDQIYNKQ